MGCAERDSQIEEARRELGEKTEQIEKLERALAERDRQVETAQRKLDESRALIAQLTETSQPTAEAEADGPVAATRDIDEQADPAAAESADEKEKTCSESAIDPADLVAAAMTRERAEHVEDQAELDDHLSELALCAARIDSLDAVDQHAWHADLGREVIAATPYAARIRFHTGRAREFLDAAPEPYDFIHDDAWFAFKPDYYEALIAALAPGGTLSLPNWFLLEDALTGEPRRDWSEFAGPDWPRAILEYAKALAGDARLLVSWSFSPPLAIVVRR